ncbi:hypothetical protein F5Y04DRAFT_250102 [Hypomontagnella monticulosa]|nr:hypothetical protein F5Y04DRAFT_250102 [Hypomontagnella monticulosa]
MSPDVAIYTTPPEALIELLQTHHLPHALPLLRRLRFTRFPGGITASSRILFSCPSPSPSSSALSGTHDGPFAAAYLDLSRGPETELWLYASLECRPDYLAVAASVGLAGTQAKAQVEGGKGVANEEASAVCAHAILREVRRQRDAYSEERRALATVVAGTLSETLRMALLNQGVVFADVSVYDKWMFRVDGLPDVRSPLEEGMRWDKFHREDIPLMLSRTNINRKERTIVLLPSMAVYRDDNTPVAWAIMGPDSSLSGLHCEEEFRGKGFAKAVAVKILRERLKDYDDDGHCWADVAPDNTQSQGVCKSLGGKVAWAISWSRIDLDRSFPDQ